MLSKLFTRRRLSSNLNNDTVDFINYDLPIIDVNFLHQYAGHLKRSVEIYFKLSTPEADGYSQNEKIFLERLGRLRGYGASPLLLSVYLLEKGPSKRLALLEAIERFQFVVSMKFGSQRAAYLNKFINIELIKFIKNKAKIEELVSFFNNNVEEFFKEDAVYDSIQEWIKNGLGYYGWRSINYFLYEYELSLKEKSKTNRLKIDWDEFNKEDYQSDYSSIEHIYPQKARSQYWTERFGRFTPTQKRLLRNSLGNLLALSSPKNASLSNKAFPDKVGREQDTVGYRYGSYSENEVATYTDWGAIEILDRGLKMLSFLEFKWGIVIGDKDQKTKALGLSFMIKK